MSEEKTPNHIDIHIGQRIRLLRRERGMSQEALGEAAGITFQQIQKYENGTNRVSGSRMWQLAKAMGVGILAFYEGLEGTPDGEAPEDLSRRRFLLTHEAKMLVEAGRLLPPKMVATFAILMQDAAAAIGAGAKKRAA